MSLGHALRGSHLPEENSVIQTGPEAERQLRLAAYGLPHGRRRGPGPGAVTPAADVALDPALGQLRALARTAARAGGLPYAVVNVITVDEQHQVAAFGVEPGVCSREDSMCARVFLSGHPTVVPDASVDDRFRDNPFVTGGGVRFYASIPLVADGVPLGSLCVFSDRAGTLEDAALEVLESLASHIVDVLDLQLRTRELDAAMARVVGNNERLSGFTGHVSHDLRAPLTSILGHLEMAEDEGADGLVLAHVSQAGNAGQRMLGMLEDLLEYSTAGHSLPWDGIDLPELVLEVVEDLGGMIDRSGAKVSCAAGTVLGNRAQTRAVVQNLVVNAVRYCPPGRAPSIVVRPVEQDGLTGLTVADNGRGIAEEDRATAIAPMSRLHLPGDPPGTGLGLSICVRVAESHGGSLTITDAPEGGAAVTVAWPASVR